MPSMTSGRSMGVTSDEESFIHHPNFLSSRTRSPHVKGDVLVSRKGRESNDISNPSESRHHRHEPSCMKQRIRSNCRRNMLSSHIDSNPMTRSRNCLKLKIGGPTRSKGLNEEYDYDSNGSLCSTSSSIGYWESSGSQISRDEKNDLVDVILGSDGFGTLANPNADSLILAISIMIVHEVRLGLTSPESEDDEEIIPFQPRPVTQERLSNSPSAFGFRSSGRLHRSNAGRCPYHALRGALNLNTSERVILSRAETEELWGVFERIGFQDFDGSILFTHRVPEIWEVSEFLTELYGATGFSAECFVIGIIYIARGLNNPYSLPLTSLSWRPVLFASLLLAHKYWDDEYLTNLDFVHGYRSHSFKDANILERSLLKLLQYNIGILPSTYAQSYFGCRTAASLFNDVIARRQREIRQESADIKRLNRVQQEELGLVCSSTKQSGLLGKRSSSQYSSKAWTQCVPEHIDLGKNLLTVIHGRTYDGSYCPVCFHCSCSACSSISSQRPFPSPSSPNSRTLLDGSKRSGLSLFQTWTRPAKAAGMFLGKAFSFKRSPQPGPPKDIHSTHLKRIQLTPTQKSQTDSTQSYMAEKEIGLFNFPVLEHRSLILMTVFPWQRYSWNHYKNTLLSPHYSVSSLPPPRKFNNTTVTEFPMGEGEQPIDPLNPHPFSLHSRCARVRKSLSFESLVTAKRTLNLFGQEEPHIIGCEQLGWDPLYNSHTSIDYCTEENTMLDLYPQYNTHDSRYRTPDKMSSIRISRHLESQLSRGTKNSFDSYIDNLKNREKSAVDLLDDGNVDGEPDEFNNSSINELYNQRSSVSTFFHRKGLSHEDFNYRNELETD